MSGLHIVDRKGMSGILGISVRTLDRCVQTYGYPFFRVGSKIRFDVNEVVEYVKSDPAEIVIKKESKSSSTYQPELDDVNIPLDLSGGGDEAAFVRVTCSRLYIETRGADTAYFSRRKISLQRGSYRVVHIDSISQEEGAWENLVIEVPEYLANTHNLPYVTPVAGDK